MGKSTEMPQPEPETRQIQVSAESMVAALRQQLAEAHQKIHDQSVELAMHKAHEADMERELSEIRSMLDELAKQSGNREQRRAKAKTAKKKGR